MLTLVAWCKALTNAEISPYKGLPENLWMQKTIELVEQHPWDTNEIVEVVISSWNGILDTRLGTGGHQIGVDVFPSPQIMGFLLHELIPLELAQNHPGVWSRDNASDEKDVVYVPDDHYSFEIKTSSNATGILPTGAMPSHR